jgi:hypothetical protein
MPVEIMVISPRIEMSERTAAMTNPKLSGVIVFCAVCVLALHGFCQSADPRADGRVLNSILTIAELKPNNAQIAEFEKRVGARVSGVMCSNGTVDGRKTSEFGTPEVTITGGMGGFTAIWGLPFDGRGKMEYGLRKAPSMFLGGAPENSVYAFEGTVTIDLESLGAGRIVLVGDNAKPLRFVLTADRGLVYLEGTGTATVKGVTSQLPKPEPAKKNSQRPVLKRTRRP